MNRNSCKLVFKRLRLVQKSPMENGFWRENGTGWGRLLDRRLSSGGSTFLPSYPTTGATRRHLGLEELLAATAFHDQLATFIKSSRR
jgi:hypothetical protein